MDSGHFALTEWVASACASHGQLKKTAFPGSCNFSKPPCHLLLGGGLRELGTPLVGEETARTALHEDDLELNHVHLGNAGQHHLQAIIDTAENTLNFQLRISYAPWTDLEFVLLGNSRQVTGEKGSRRTGVRRRS